MADDADIKKQEEAQRKAARERRARQQAADDNTSSIGLMAQANTTGFPPSAGAASSGTGVQQNAPQNTDQSNSTQDATDPAAVTSGASGAAAQPTAAALAQNSATIQRPKRYDLFGNEIVYEGAEDENSISTSPEADNKQAANYWAGVDGYDHEIFEKDDVEQADLAQNESFIKAAEIIYEMEGGDPADFKGDNEGLTSWAVGHMRGFNMNLANMTQNTIQITNATPEQKQAFVYLMDSYDHMDASVSGFFKSIGWLAADPTTYVGLGTLGIGFAAKEATKQAGKAGIKELLKQGVKEDVIKKAVQLTVMEKVKTGAKIGAAEGAVYTLADGSLRQAVEITSDRQKDGWSWWSTAGDLAQGSAFGLGGGILFSWAGPAIGRFMRENKYLSKLTEKFTRKSDEQFAKTVKEAEAELKTEADAAAKAAEDAKAAEAAPDARAADDTDVTPEADAQAQAEPEVSVEAAAPTGRKDPDWDATTPDQFADELERRIQGHRNLREETLNLLDETGAQRVKMSKGDETIEVDRGSSPQTPASGNATPNEAPSSATTNADDAATDTATRTQDEATNAGAKADETPEAPTNTGGAAGATAARTTTPPPKANNTANLIDAPYRSWMHKAIHWYYPTRLGARLRGSVNPADNLPNELAGDRHLLGYINTVDELILGGQSTKEAGAIGKKESERVSQILGNRKTTVDLNTTFGDLREKLAKLQDGIKTGALTNDQAKAQAVDIIQKFTNDPGNKAALKSFAESMEGVIQEVNLEKALSESIDAVKGKKEKEIAKEAKIQAEKARKLIEEYEAKTGREFIGKEERIDFIKNLNQEGFSKGQNQFFYLRSHQAATMLEDATGLYANAQDMLHPDFAQNYAKQIGEALETDGVQEPFLRGISKLATETQAARMRYNNRDASQTKLWWLPVGAPKMEGASLIDVNLKRLSLQRGYYNPYHRQIPIEPPPQDGANVEWNIMNVEDMDTSDTGLVGELIGLAERSYLQGEELQFIDAFHRLNQKAVKMGEDGNIAGNRALLDAFQKEIGGVRNFRNKGGKHFEYFESQLRRIDIKNNPWQYAQREMYQLFTQATYIPHHARKYVADGDSWSIPFEVYTRQSPEKAFWAYGKSMLLGGRVVWETSDGNKVPVPIYKFGLNVPQDAGAFRKAMTWPINVATMLPYGAYNTLSYPFRLAANITGKTATSRFVGEALTATSIYGGGLWAAEEGLEEAFQYAGLTDTWVTDENGNIEIMGVRPDLGSRFFEWGFLKPADLILGTPIRTVLEGYKWAGNTALGYAGFESDSLLGTGLQPSHFSLNQEIPFLGHSINSGFAEFTGDRGSSPSRKLASSEGGAANPEQQSSSRSNSRAQERRSTSSSSKPSTVQNEGGPITTKLDMNFGITAQGRDAFAALRDKVAQGHTITQADILALAPTLHKLDNDLKTVRALKEKAEKAVEVYTGETSERLEEAQELLNAATHDEPIVSGLVEGAYKQRNLGVIAFHTQTITDAKDKKRVEDNLQKIVTAADTAYTSGKIEQRIDLLDTKYLRAAKKDTLTNNDIAVLLGTAPRKGRVRERFNGAANVDFGATAGNAIGTIFNTLFDWDGDGKAISDGFAAKSGIYASSAFRAVSGFFGDMPISWKVGGGAVLGGLLLTNIASSMLGVKSNFIKMPLMLAVIGGLGHLITHGIRQGSGKHTPNMVAANDSVDHSGRDNSDHDDEHHHDEDHLETSALNAPLPQQSMVAQVTGTPGRKSFAPNNHLQLVGGTDVAGSRQHTLNRELDDQTDVQNIKIDAVTDTGMQVQITQNTNAANADQFEIRALG